ncbi:MAG: type II/IV secretion system protein, partial [Planctomycetota bacterium]|nr:type II/IV secretion system protein [Planctomycetota bacterium]
MISLQAQVLPSQPRLDQRQIGLAREAQSTDGSLRLVAAELGCDTEEEALSAVGESLGLDVVDLSNTDVDLSLLADFPLKLIHRHGIFP